MCQRVIGLQTGLERLGLLLEHVHQVLQDLICLGPEEMVEVEEHHS